MKYLIYSFIIVFFLSCHQDKKKLNTPYSQHLTPYSLHINRYEVALFKMNPNNLANEIQAIHKQYRFFVGDNYNDKNSIKQLYDYVTDPIIKAIYNDVMKAYPDLNDVESQFSEAFTNLKALYPNTQPPKVYTYVSGIDYDNPIRYADTAIAVSLDMYLGANYASYSKLGIPDYMRVRQKKEYIVRDCIKLIAENYLSKPPNTPTMLDNMLEKGKILFFTQALLPKLPDYINMGYTNEQLKWCKKNESSLWAFFIDNKLLFKNDNTTITKFLGDGPFTTPLGKESPARVGEWLGWQIILSYMQNNKNITVQFLMSDADSQQILNKSKYKPHK